MYAGEIVEFGTLEQVFDKNRPHHPYTVGLFGSIPDLSSTKSRLEPISGMTPDPSDLPQGCYFSPRCLNCKEICKAESAKSIVSSDGHMLKCHLFDTEKEEA